MNFDGIGPRDFLKGLVAKATTGEAESRKAVSDTGAGAKFRPPEGEIFIASKNGQRGPSRQVGEDFARVDLANKPDQSGLTATGSVRARLTLSQMLQGASRLDTAA